MYAQALPAAKETLTVARALAPKKTGRLAQRLRVSRAGSGFAVLGGPVQIYQLDGRRVPYIYPIVSGAVPHEITPRKRRALKIGSDFAASSSHPGIGANPFLNEAALSYRTLYFRRAGHAVGGF
jgi:hypothetical protein